MNSINLITALLAVTPPNQFTPLLLDRIHLVIFVLISPPLICCPLLYRLETTKPKLILLQYIMHWLWTPDKFRLYNCASYLFIFHHVIFNCRLLLCNRGEGDNWDSHIVLVACLQSSIVESLHHWQSSLSEVWDMYSSMPHGISESQSTIHLRMIVHEFMIHVQNFRATNAICWKAPVQIHFPCSNFSLLFEKIHHHLHVMTTHQQCFQAVLL